MRISVGTSSRVAVSNFVSNELFRGFYLISDEVRSGFSEISKIQRNFSAQIARGIESRRIRKMTLSYYYSGVILIEYQFDFVYGGYNRNIRFLDEYRLRSSIRGIYLHRFNARVLIWDFAWRNWIGWYLTDLKRFPDSVYNKIDSLGSRDINAYLTEVTAKIREESFSSSGAFWGSIIGILLGPLGMIIGGVLGGIYGSRKTIEPRRMDTLGCGENRW